MKIIDDEIIKIIRKHIQYQGKLNEDTLLSLLEMNSLSFIALIVDLEDFFNVEAGNEQLNILRYNTVGELLKFF